MRPNGVTLLVFALLILRSSESWAEEGCSCKPTGDPRQDQGILWSGTSPPSLEEIARMLAPVLWYTSDEPAILQGETPLPHAHPCDERESDGVVYYQVNWLVKRGRDNVTRPFEEDPAFADKVASLGLRYYFYHDFDYGLNPHRHDLEMAEMRVEIEHPGRGCYRIRLKDTIGFAHGTDWYSNELVTTTDTRLPLTLLIEEGKHASSPDRNADGVYTPGYDINVRVNDAWGLRDVMGSGYLISPQYQAFMSKRRTAETRVVPPSFDRNCVSPGIDSLQRYTQSLNRYELRPGDRVKLCTGIEHYEHLAKWSKKNKFGEDYFAPQHETDLEEALSSPITSHESWYPKISFRHDGNNGFSLVFNGFDLKELYIVPKINLVSQRYSAELLFTRSATQFVSPYFSAGFARERETDDGAFESNFSSEIGMKIRLRVDWPWRILGAGYEFAGIRIGARKIGFDQIGNFRFIFELGAGLW